MTMSADSDPIVDATEELTETPEQPKDDQQMSLLPAQDEEFNLRPQRLTPIYSDEQIIESAMAWFREHGFPYKTMAPHEMMQEINRLAMTKDEPALLNSVLAYSIADVFNPHRFHVTVEGKVSPFECFNNDHKFRRALENALKNGGIPAGFFGELTLALGTQQCSNFRPGFACLLYRKYCQEGAVVLDTSTGFGGRLVGFIAANIRNSKYIGVDPNTLTHKANLEMARVLGFADRVTLHNSPAEDLDPHLLDGQCDFAFTSPPYFSKEHYSEEETQSWKRYGDSVFHWLNGFMRPMLTLTFNALKPGCHAIINIEDVKIGGADGIKRFPFFLVQHTIDYAKQVGFLHTGDEVFSMQPRVGANQELGVAKEHVLRFKKPA